MQDYQSLTGQVQWLFAQPTLGASNQLNSETDEIGHGSCVAAKAVGGPRGVSKDADLVIVKDNTYAGTSKGQSETTGVEIIMGLNLLLQDILKRDSNTPKILVLAFSCEFLGKLPAKSFIKTDASNSGGDLERSEFIYNAVHDFFTALIDHGVSVVVSAGNKANNGHPNVDAYPALWANTLPIIVVGSSNDQGQKSSFSQGGPLVTVYASGERIQCPSTVGIQVKYKSGTSFAAPAVAGLAANLWSDPAQQQRLRKGGVSSYAQNTKDLIIDLAYSRTAGGVDTIWNGFDWSEEYYDSCAGGRSLGKRGSCSKQICLIQLPSSDID